MYLNSFEEAGREAIRIHWATSWLSSTKYWLMEKGFSNSSTVISRLTKW